MPSEEVRREVATVRQYFRKEGLRWTKQRQQIVEEAFLTHSHFRAEALSEMLRRRHGEGRVHLATVYRTLQVLEEGGFIEGMDLGEGGRLYEHVLGHAHHDHLVCVDCGHILEFNDPAMEERKRHAAQRHGLTMTGHSLQIYGRCQELERTGNCARMASSSSPDPAADEGS